MSELIPRSRLAAWQQNMPWLLASSGSLVLLAALTGLTLPWGTGGTALVIDVSLCAVTGL